MHGSKSILEAVERNRPSRERALAMSLAVPYLLSERRARATE